MSDVAVEATEVPEFSRHVGVGEKGNVRFAYVGPDGAIEFSFLLSDVKAGNDVVAVHVSKASITVHRLTPREGDVCRAATCQVVGGKPCFGGVYEFENEATSEFVDALVEFGQDGVFDLLEQAYPHQVVV